MLASVLIVMLASVLIVMLASVLIVMYLVLNLSELLAKLVLATTPVAEWADLNWLTASFSLSQVNPGRAS